MKILLFANSDWYLYNFRLSLAQVLRAQGHEVLLLCPPGRYVDELRQAGFRWIGFELSRSGMNPWSELATLGRLVLLYRRERPDVVHHFTIKCVLYGSIAARLAPIGAVINAVTGLGHVFSASDLTARIVRPGVDKLYRLALHGTQVIFQNPDDQAAFLARGLTKHAECHLIRGSGVDVARFRPPESRPDGEVRQVLLASRLLWAKGVGEFVEAARRVRQIMPQAVFLIAGESDAGNPGAIPAATIESWKTQGDIKILGHCDDMAPLLRQVDLVVLPSYYGEGVPRSLTEAAASGLPLIASDTPGCREIVMDGVNGILVPPRNVERLVEAILALLQSRVSRAEMGKRSRELACREFAEEGVLQQTLRIYEKVRPA